MARLSVLLLSVQLAVFSSCLFPTKDCDRQSCMPAEQPDAGLVDLAMGDLAVPDLSMGDLQMDDLRPECQNESECGPGLACKAGVCTSCIRHADCKSKVCDIYQTGPKGKGVCLPEAEGLFVDNKNGACVGMHTGDLANPFCSIDDAVAKLSATKKWIRVFPSIKEYPLSPITGATTQLALYGSAGEGGKVLLGAMGQMVAVSVRGSARALLDGVEISRSQAGVECSDGGMSAVELRRSSVVSVSLGVYINDCKVSLDRTLIQLCDIALSVTGTKDLLVTNSFVVSNTAPLNANPLSIDTSGTKVFRFNTVVNNQASSTDRTGFLCGSPLTIEDSIVAGNAMSMGTQFTGMCSLSMRSVVGSTEAGMGGVKADPDFVTVPDPITARDINFGLNQAAEINKMHLIDRAEGLSSTDYFGTERPKGGGPDVGAHEVN